MSRREPAEHSATPWMSRPPIRRMESVGHHAGGAASMAYGFTVNVAESMRPPAVIVRVAEVALAMVAGGV